MLVLSFVFVSLEVSFRFLDVLIVYYRSSLSWVLLALFFHAITEAFCFAGYFNIIAWWLITFTICAFGHNINTNLASFYSTASNSTLVIFNLICPYANHTLYYFFTIFSQLVMACIQICHTYGAWPSFSVFFYYFEGFF